MSDYSSQYIDHTVFCSLPHLQLLLFILYITHVTGPLTLSLPIDGGRFRACV